jgi:DNA-binding MarR family transcriptional regulator
MMEAAMTTGHELAMALRAAYWAMHRGADSCLQPLGVTANQFVLLSLLDEADAVTQQELVLRASSDPNTVRAMLVVLEEKGLVVRKRHPTDGRARCVALSAKGRRAYRGLREESESFRDSLMEALRPGEPDALLEMLGRIREAMEPRELRASPQLQGDVS